MAKSLLRPAMDEQILYHSPLSWQQVTAELPF